jgi:hypothetical protein
MAKKWQSRLACQVKSLQTKILCATLIPETRRWAAGVPEFVNPLGRSFLQYLELQ